MELGSAEVGTLLPADLGITHLSDSAASLNEFSSEEFCKHAVELLESPSLRTHLLDSIKEEVRKEVQCLLRDRSEAIVPGLRSSVEEEEDLETEIVTGMHPYD